MLNKRYVVVVVSLLILLVAGCNSRDVKDVSQPYAGMKVRSIKAISEEEINGLLEGKGLKYALTAELNQYPGPSHSLDFASELGLSEEQEKVLTALKEKVNQEAKILGKQLVELEERLDKAFSEGTITKEQLEKLTNEIAIVDGQLRNVHLQTHLDVKEILTPEQITNYDELRGYSKKINADNHNQH